MSVPLVLEDARSFLSCIVADGKGEKRIDNGDIANQKAKAEGGVNQRNSTAR